MYAEIPVRALSCQNLTAATMYLYYVYIYIYYIMYCIYDCMNLCNKWTWCDGVVCIIYMYICDVHTMCVYCVAGEQ